eukprot:CAMPEP_0197726924 /NCGR_PEP_ID=MMETSP1434-20131217/17709_1 /TAXON_ID=265543 /ORGANISM="Minutocellus polymorphus, Strain CCMP3303" /LENGTH=193 /DNA_ID=CAMNT_0043312979 /DNA_START=101 /DNA_END=682 /DNA_ORIENTATION=+
MTSTCTTTTLSTPMFSSLSSGSYPSPRTIIPSHPSQVSQKRGLKFSRRTRIYLVPTLNELTQEEYDACYRTSEDEKESQDHLVKTITTARQHGGVDIPRNLRDQLTTRGIEHMACSSRMRQRSAIKKRVVNAVLDEQDQQFDDYEAGKTSSAVSDPERIASISQRLTRQCANAAWDKGIQDAEEAAALRPKTK